MHQDLIDVAEGKVEHAQTLSNGLLRGHRVKACVRTWISCVYRLVVIMMVVISVDGLIMPQIVRNAKAILEYAGGVVDQPPFPPLSWIKSGLLWGAWWAVLILLIVAFSGQSSKFIYIDF